MNYRFQNNNTNTAEKIIGTAGTEGTSHLIEQNYDDTCAIRSQELILRDFGINISEHELREQAIDNQWYTPGRGTSSDDVGNLLELHGVDVNRYEDANIFSLTKELAQGKRVIIGVDSGELWYPENELGEDNIADHALIVSGIDTSDINNIKVILTDPGTGDIAQEYPIAQFIDAWEDSNFEMISTEEAAPLEYNPEMINFDYAQGHISEIGNLSYNHFEQLFSPCIELEIDNAMLQERKNILIQLVDEGNDVSYDYLNADNNLIFENNKTQNESLLETNPIESYLDETIESEEISSDSIIHNEETGDIYNFEQDLIP